MNDKYTAEQVEDYARACALIHKGPVIAEMLRDYATHLRERESAKAGVPDEIVKEAVDVYEIVYNGNDLDIREKMRDPDTECMRAALEAVAPMLASARVPYERKATMYADESRQDHYEAAIYDKGWNACREAMLSAPNPEKEEREMKITIGDSQSIADALLREIERVQELLTHYDATLTGIFVAPAMRKSIKAAHSATVSGDVVEMLRCYEDLKEYGE